MVTLVPSLEQFMSHDGLHYRHLWRETGINWACPGCHRSKFQIMRWTKRFPNGPNSFMGWVAALHRHHDHSGDLPGSVARFPRTVICDQCNSADGAAKRHLKLPQKFSFSPSEISLFVSATPHGRHTINFQSALAVYQALESKNSSKPTPLRGAA